MNNSLITAELLKPGGVAAVLKHARTGANLRGNELARRAGWRASKVSKLEHGQQMPTADDLHTWLSICGLTGQAIRETVAKLDEVRHAYPDLQRLHRQVVKSQPAGSVTIMHPAYVRGYADAFRAIQEHFDEFLSACITPAAPENGNTTERAHSDRSNVAA